MGKSTTIVTHKPSTQSTEEFIIIVNPEEYKKYKDGDTSIALARIVDSFDVFHSSTGHQGKLGKASKQQLDSISDKKLSEDEVVKFILDNGTSKSVEGFASNFGDTNSARGSGDISSRGGPGR